MKYLGPPQSGSIANQCFSRNGGGQYVRARAGRGGAGEVYFGGLATAWQTLQESERLLWNEFAESRIGKIDSLGRAIKISGFAWFCRQNLVLHFVAGSTLQTVPVIPSASAKWATCVLQSVVISTITWDVTISFPAGSSGAAMVSSPGVVTAGTMSAPGRGKWWQDVWPISWSSTDLSPLTFNIGFAWFAHFGAFPALNDWIFTGVRPVLFSQALGARQVIRSQAL